jgi:hypothetical protein
VPVAGAATLGDLDELNAADPRPTQALVEPSRHRAQT